MKNSAVKCQFQYQGINKLGQKKKGSIQAPSLALAKSELHKKGLIIEKIRPKRQTLFYAYHNKISQVDLSVLSRQMATMIASGIPVVQTLELMAKGQNNKRLKLIINTIKEDIETGLSLSESLAKHPLYFNELFCNLVNAGEKSGCLDVMLEKIATYKEKIETIKKRIKKTLTYPFAILLVALFVSCALLIFVVPQFESLFSGLGAELPAMTKAVVLLSKGLKTWWAMVVILLGLMLYVFLYAKKNAPGFAKAIDQIALKMPIMGDLLEKAVIARFTRTLAITFAAGLTLVDALDAVAGVTGNSVYANASLQIKDEISKGQLLNVAIEKTHLFPNMVVQMIAIGEESGALEKMLGKVADFYEEDVDNKVDSLSSLIEPIIMCVLGVLIGGLIIAMYLPIFKLGTVV